MNFAVVGQAAALAAVAQRARDAGGVMEARRSARREAVERARMLGGAVVCVGGKARDVVVEMPVERMEEWARRLDERDREEEREWGEVLQAVTAELAGLSFAGSADAEAAPAATTHRRR